MNWTKEQQKSYKMQNDIKDDRIDCPICESPVSLKDFDYYKMCPRCYSQHNLDNEGGAIYQR